MVIFLKLKQWGILTCLVLLCVSCPAETDKQSEIQATPAPIVWAPVERDLLYTLSPLPPLPPDPTNRWADHPKAAKLGQYLFFDKRLSPSGRFSCQTCHQSEKGFSDGLAVSKGLGKTLRNAPTLWNTAYQRWYFWDGRTDSLWAQAIQPLESEAEMGSSRLEVAHLFSQDEELKQAYEAIFGPLPDFSDFSRFPAAAKPMPTQPKDPRHVAWLNMSSEDQAMVNRFITHILKTLAAYERLLVTQPAPFDKFVAELRQSTKKTSALLSPEAQRGLKLFIGRGQCILCHTGPLFSDREFHNLGLPAGGQGTLDRGRYQGIAELKRDPFNRLGMYSDLAQDSPEVDQIRYLVQLESNLGEFKTPTLRQVSESSPYMHDGRFGTLEEVLAFYSNPSGEPPIGRREDTIQALQLESEALLALKAFLESLSGPMLPESLTTQPKKPF